MLVAGIYLLSLAYIQGKMIIQGLECRKANIWMEKLTENSYTTGTHAYVISHNLINFPEADP